jgi:hypothetical protein
VTKPGYIPGTFARAYFHQKGGKALVFFLHGILVIPPFLFQKYFLIKLAIASLYYVMLFIGNRKPKIIPALLLFCAILLSNLLIPEGKVILSIWAFPITLGALSGGAGKALNIVGLLFISQFSIRKDIALPGSFGRIVSKTLGFLDEFLKKKNRIPLNKGLTKILTHIDDFIVQIWKTGRSRKREQMNVISLLYLIEPVILIIINWLLFILVTCIF